MTALERAIARPEPVHEFAATSPLDGLDRRSVGFADVLAQSVAAVAPSAAATTMILLVSGVATPGGTLLAVVIASVLALVVARTISQFTKRLVASGSLYTYVARGLGAAPALVAGAAVSIGYGFVSVFALLGGAHYLMILAQRVWPSFGGGLATVGLLVLEAAVLTLVLVRGIRISTRVALVVEVVSVAIIVALLAVLLVLAGPVEVGLMMPGDGVSPTAIAAGVVLALTAFVGFESASTLGVEARAPLRNIPRAITSTVVVAGGLYVLAAYVQVAGFAALGRDLADSESPVNELATAFGIDSWGVLADVGIAASFLACAIASTTALTRVLFAMGRDGVLPVRFGRTHTVHRTPIAAVAVAVPLVSATPIGLVLAGVGPWDAMEAVIVVSAAGYITAYALVCLAAPAFLRRIGELTPVPAIVGWASSAVLGAGLAVYLVVETSAGNPGAWAAVALAGVVAVGVLWRLRTGRSALDGIGAYDEPVASQVLGGIARRRSARHG